MLTEDQIKRLVSSNDSLQVQINDLNYMLAERERELQQLQSELAQATSLRSQMDGQQAEIESIQDKLGQRQMQAKGAATFNSSVQQIPGHPRVEIRRSGHGGYFKHVRHSGRGYLPAVVSAVSPRYRLATISRLDCYFLTKKLRRRTITQIARVTAIAVT